ncbi:hypothetical protein SAMN05192573_101551 [Mucilaginibacter gossypii]|uniref:Uncharacterized protein n=1 Tax=Mucilaginibacter gossypii TaxID=551996 RepID=A0A1G7PGF3_9SPHI|nr:hypothetical protein SAMN05192573_101551 [Mucilaginibacter gossypii]
MNVFCRDASHASPVGQAVLNKRASVKWMRETHVMRLYIWKSSFLNSLEDLRSFRNFVSLVFII